MVAVVSRHGARDAETEHHINDTLTSQRPVTTGSRQGEAGEKGARRGEIHVPGQEKENEHAENAG